MLVRWIKGVSVGLICLLVLFIGVMFTINNTVLVSINLVFFTLPEASLSTWLVATFIMGGIFGMLVSVVTVLTLRARLRAEKRRVTNANKELDKLRTNGLTEAV